MTILTYKLIILAAEMIARNILARKAVSKKIRLNNGSCHQYIKCFYFLRSPLTSNPLSPLPGFAFLTVHTTILIVYKYTEK